MELEELQRAIEAILFASGERIDIQRFADVFQVDPIEVEQAADSLANTYAFERRGMRILKLEKGYQMVSSGEMAEYVTKVLETRKPQAVLFPVGDPDHRRLLSARYKSHGGTDPWRRQRLFCGGAAEQKTDRRSRTFECSRPAHSV